MSGALKPLPEDAESAPLAVDQKTSDIRASRAEGGTKYAGRC